MTTQTLTLIRSSCWGSRRTWAASVSLYIYVVSPGWHRTAKQRQQRIVDALDILSSMTALCTFMLRQEELKESKKSKTAGRAAIYEANRQEEGPKLRTEWREGAL